MAKVKSIKMRLGIDQSCSWKETVVSICYDATDRNSETYRRKVPSEDQRFYIMLPKVVSDSLGQDRVFGKDQKDVMTHFEEALVSFKTLKVVVNRVILYDFDQSSPDSSSIGSDYKVRVWAGTYEETVMTAGDGAERYSYERIESEVNYDPDPVGKWYRGYHSRTDGERKKHQVPWSDQNAAFFLWIKENMKLLIERLARLDEPANLIETVNAGRLLPFGGPEGGNHAQDSATPG